MVRHNFHGIYLKFIVLPYLMKNLFEPIDIDVTEYLFQYFGIHTRWYLVSYTASGVRLTGVMLYIISLHDIWSSLKGFL